MKGLGEPRWDLKGGNDAKLSFRTMMVGACVCGADQGDETGRRRGERGSWVCLSVRVGKTAGRGRASGHVLLRGEEVEAGAGHVDGEEKHLLRQSPRIWVEGMRGEGSRIVAQQSRRQKHRRQAEDSV